MNNQQVTDAIILARLDYGEADRILTLLTPEHGKLRLLAKGVRRVKSKLAGGIELFSVSTITFIRGKKDIGTLVSTRLVTHYGNIVADLDRTMLGYELIKQLNKLTEDEPDADYFHLLKQAFEALNDSTISLLLIRLWFTAQLLALGGHAPNLQTDEAGNKLAADTKYLFNYDTMCFSPVATGKFTPDHVKLLRLVFNHANPAGLQKIANIETLVPPCEQLTQHLVKLIA